MPINDRVAVLGVEVSAVDLDGAVRFVRDSVRQRRKTYISLATAHGVMDAQASEPVRAAFNGSGLTVPDGMSMVWLLKLAGRREVTRVYGPELLDAVCADSRARGLRHFFLGASDRVGESLVRRLSERFADLEVAGRFSPPFRSLEAGEEQEIVAQINRSGADVVWVGLGTPRQDLWMAEHRDALDAPVLIGVGAAFDFLAGAKPQAPRWLQRAGLEWAFRLATEPVRLAPRYARYPKFLWLVAKERLRGSPRTESNGSC